MRMKKIVKNRTLQGIADGYLCSNEHTGAQKWKTRFTPVLYGW